MMFNFKTSNHLINLEVNHYLDNVIKNKLFANGYIFYGVDGVGKKQKSIDFIKKIFEQYSSSGNIEKKIDNNNHPDLLIIEPTSSNKSTKKNLDSEIPKKNNSEIIKIDQVRHIKTFLSQKSIDSEKKVVLIIDAHLLNEAASNCLLKTLEEPMNGIIILLTSQLNLLLDTIKSRCQLVRFKAFSKRELEIYLKENLDSSQLEINKNINLQDLLNSSNGSPKKLLNIIEICNLLSDEILYKLESPLKDNFEIFSIAKSLSEQLEAHQQICLINLIQQIWWRKTKNVNLVKRLESLKKHIKNQVQSRLAWEVTLIKIAMHEL